MTIEDPPLRSNNMLILLLIPRLMLLLLLTLMGRHHPARPIPRRSGERVSFDLLWRPCCKRLMGWSGESAFIFILIFKFFEWSTNRGHDNVGSRQPTTSFPTSKIQSRFGYIHKLMPLCGDWALYVHLWSSGSQKPPASTFP